MSRLVVAVLILFAVLIGLRAANSSPFQLNFLNQGNNTTPETRNTGFSAESTATASSGGVSQAGFNAPSQGSAGAGTSAGTTSLPPQTQQRPVPGSW
ncbi:MAG: hypothetical protein ACAF41_21350 [Leptolyngbya sp. BL-A-14]